MDQDTVDNSLELRKYLVQVQSRIKNEVTSDFTLATVLPEEKEGIIEITTNAFEARKKFENIAKCKRWNWDKKEKAWILNELNKQQKEIINQHTNQTFDTYMNRVFMMITMNRNKANNPLASMLVEEARKDVEVEGNEERMTKLLEKLGVPPKKQNE